MQVWNLNKRLREKDKIKIKEIQVKIKSSLLMIFHKSNEPLKSSTLLKNNLKRTLESQNSQLKEFDMQRLKI